MNKKCVVSFLLCFCIAFFILFGNGTIVKAADPWISVGDAGFSISGTSAYTSMFIYEGTPYVAYYDGANSGKATVKYYNGTSWVTLGSAGFSVGAATYISLYVYNGTPYVCYRDAGNSSYANVKYYDGTNWVSLGSTGFSLGVAAYTSLYIYNGVPYVAYQISNKATVKYYNGSAWVTLGSAGFSAGIPTYISLVVDNGTPYIAYADSVNSNKATVMYYNGTSWVNLGTPGFSAGTATYVSLKVYNGTPYVSYTDAGNSSKATVMYYNGSNWTNLGNAGFSAGTATYTSLYINNGVVYVSYRDYINAYKATVMYYNGSAWTNVGTAGFTSTSTTYNSLYFNGATPYLAYIDSTYKVNVMKNFISIVAAPSGLSAIAGNENVALRWNAVVGAQSYKVYKSTTPGNYGAEIATVTNGNTYNVQGLTNGISYYFTVKATGESGDSPPSSEVSAVPKPSSWNNLGNAGFSEGTVAYTSSYVYNGVQYIAFRDGSKSNKATVMKFDGTNWVTVGTAGFSAGAAEYLSLCVYNDIPYVAYKDAGNANKATVMKLNGTSWVAVGTAGLSSSTVEYTSLHIQEGIPYVAYRDDAKSYKATVKKYDEATTSWVTVGTEGFSDGIVASISLITDHGSPYVAYQDGEHGSKATVMKFDGTNWVTIGTAGCSSGVINYPSLSVYNSVPYLAFSDNTNNYKATVIYFDDVSSSWKTVGIPGFTSGVAGSMSLSIRNGKPYIAYQDGNMGNKATAMYFDGTEWKTIGSAGFSAGVVSSVSMNVSGETAYVAYGDEGNASKATVMKYFVDVPTSPSSVSAVVENGSIALNWESITGATQYKIFKRLAGNSYEAMPSYTTSDNHYQITNLSNTTSYSFVIKAGNEFGDSPASSEISATPNIIEWQNVGNAGFSAGVAEYTTLFASEDILYVAYKDRGNAGKATVMKLNGSSWECVGSAGFTQGVANETSLSVWDSKPYVAYADSSNGDKATVMYYNGTNWTVLGSAGFSTGSVSNLSLYIYNGTPYVAYTDNANSNAAIVKYYNGTTWISVGSAGLSGGTTDYLSLYVYNNKPYLAFSDGSKGNKITAVYFNGSSWVTIGNAGFSDGVANDISLSVSGGTPYVAFQDDANDSKATVMAFDGFNWVNVGSAGFTSGLAKSIKLFNYEKTSYVAFVDSANGSKATVMFYNGTQWVNVSNPGFSEGLVDYISLYVNKGIPYVAYQDASYSEKATVMKYYIEIPAAPTDITSTEGDASITLHWAPSLGATGYKIYKSTSSGVEGSLIATVNGVTTYTLTGLTNDTIYYLTMKATNEGGESSFSGEISERPIKTHTITFGSQGGSAVSSINNVPNNSSVALPAAPVKEGFSFAGWNTMADGSGINFTASTLITANTSVYAQWTQTPTLEVTQTTYTVTFNKNGGDAEANPTTQTVASGDSVEILPTAPVKSGATFKGWNTAAGGTGTAFTAATAVTANITVYAQWSANTVVKSAGSSGGAPAGGGTNVNDQNGLISINGDVQNIVTENIVTDEEGRQGYTAKIDEQALLDLMIKSDEKLVIEVSKENDNQIASAVLSAKTIETLGEKGELTIKNDLAAYILPLDQIDIASVMKNFEPSAKQEDVEITITVAKVTQQTEQKASVIASKNDFEIFALPIEFSMSAIYNNKTIEISRFNNYVSRLVEIENQLPSDKTITGIVVEADGTFRQVPTKIEVIDGKKYARMSSMTNSVYMVIGNQVTFKDTEKSWAKKDIDDLASRTIISGTDEGLFMPDKDISRAEFATILVRGLGLKISESKSSFKDISENAWYKGYVQTAYENGIMHGYSDGMSKATNKVTRQEAMSMITRAMKMTGLEAQMTESEVELIINAFADGNKASGWARTDIAKCIKAGIVSGTDMNEIAPTQNITKAQVAKIIKNLLLKSKLI